MMPLDGITGPGGVNLPPEGLGPRKAAKAPEGVRFEDVLELTMRPQIEDALRYADANAVVNTLLSWYNNPANLVIAMSVIASWEIGRREAVRDEMQRREQDARLQDLVRQFDEATKRV